MEEGLFFVVAEKGVEDLFCGCGDAEGHGSAGEAFAEADDVGLPGAVFACEEFTGPSETCEDFVCDAEDAVSGETFEDAVEEFGGICFHATGGLEEGFVDTGCELVGVAVDEGEGGFDVIGGRGIDEDDFEKVIVEGGSEDAAFADGHGSEGIAVVGVTEGEDTIAFGYGFQVVPILDGHFDGYFDGGGSVVGIEDTGEGAGEEGEESFGEGDGGFVCEAGEDDVFEGIGLPEDGPGDMGVAVSVNIDPPGAYRVYIGVVLVVE